MSMKHAGADADHGHGHDPDYQRAIDAWVSELDNLVMHYAMGVRSSLRRHADS